MLKTSLGSLIQTILVSKQRILCKEKNPWKKNSSQRKGCKEKYFLKFNIFGTVCHENHYFLDIFPMTITFFKQVNNKISITEKYFSKNHNFHGMCVSLLLRKEQKVQRFDQYNDNTINPFCTKYVPQITQFVIDILPNDSAYISQLVCL